MHHYCKDYYQSILYFLLVILYFICLCLIILVRVWLVIVGFIGFVFFDLFAVFLCLVIREGRYFIILIYLLILVRISCLVLLNDVLIFDLFP